MAFPNPSGHSRTHPYSREQRIIHISGPKGNSWKRLEDNANPKSGQDPFSLGAGQRQAPSGCERGRLPPMVPQPKYPWRSLSQLCAFPAGHWARTALGWQQLGPCTCRSSSHASQTPPPSSVLLPDGRSLMLSPHFKPFP